MKKTTSLFTLIALALGMANTALASFPDTVGHQYEDAINFVQAQGIVDGYPSGIYDPNKTINRAEFTKIITSTTFTVDMIEACDTSEFPDVVEGDWFLPYVCIAQENDIIEGYEDGTFRPTDKITIVEAAKIITLGFSFEVVDEGGPWYKSYILALEDEFALPTTLTGFSHEITRAEMAQMIYLLETGIQDLPSTYYYNLDVLEDVEKMNISYVDASDYNDSIVEIYGYGIDAYLYYTDAADNAPLNKFKLEILDVERQESAAYISHLRDKIVALEGFEGDTSLRNVFAAEFQTWIDLLNNEEESLIELYMEMSESLVDTTEADADLEESLISAINEKVLAADSIGTEVQILFAQKHDFELESVTASLYSDKITALYYDAFSVQNAYDAVVNETDLGEDFTVVTEARVAAIAEVNALKTELAALGSYDGDDGLQVALDDYLNVMIKTLENEEAGLVELWDSVGNNQMTEEELELQTQLIDVIVLNHNGAYTALLMTQNDFAVFYGFELIMN